MSWSKSPLAQSNMHISRTFDHESGLQYDEIEVLAPITRSLSWIIDYRNTFQRQRTKRTSKELGSRSLVDIVCYQLVKDSDSLTPQHFRQVPWALAERIWQQIVDLRMENFHIWRTFALAYRREFSNKEHRYMLEIKSPSPSKQDDFRALNSITFRWLTCLRISPKQLSTAELVSVSSITNLVILDLSDGQHHIESRESTFDERVLRSWSELADDRRAFQHLRVFMLGWQEKLRAWIFQRLSTFPKLRQLLITDCKYIHHKNHKDWEEEAFRYQWSFYPAKRGVKHLKCLFEDENYYTCAASSLLYDSNCGEHTIKQEKNLGAPLLECTYGNPKKWFHIIDEFPGTRTVILHKEATASQTPQMPPQENGQKETSKRDCASPTIPLESKRIHRPVGNKKKSRHTVASLLLDIASRGNEI